MPATVAVDSRRMIALGRRIKNPAAIGILHKKIGAIYRSAMQERFSTFSRGGGDWPKMSARTFKARRKGKGQKTANLLIDTGLMFGALSPALASGGLEESRGTIVTLGFGGPTRHPNGSATIADIASFHQFGGGKLPKREILVAPETNTLNLMIRKVDEWLMTQ